MLDPITWFTRLQERRRLLRMDDQMLDDIGCSRALLHDGVRAWPWRLPEESMERLGRFRLGRARQITPPAAMTSPARAAAMDLADFVLDRRAIWSFLSLAWTR